MKSKLDKRRTKPPPQRRREMLDASAGLFRERGFAETTIGDIAAASGVATGTVYIYFPSKDHILLALHEEFHEGLADRITSIASDAFERRSRGEQTEFRRTVDSIVDAIVEYSVENKDKAHVCMRHLPASGDLADLGSVDRHFIRFLAGVFEVAEREGLIQTSDPEMLAYLINAAIGYPIGSSLAFGDPPDLDRLVAAMKELLYRALNPWS